MRLGAPIAGVVTLRRSWSREEPARYETARVDRGDVVVAVTATGNLEPIDAVDVGSDVSGRVVRVLVECDDVVAEGGVLAELDRVLLEAELAQVELARAGEEEAWSSTGRGPRTPASGPGRARSPSAGRPGRRSTWRVRGSTGP